MNKTAKSLLIPVAAFALTATGVSAFNSDLLSEAGLTEEQISAFEEARELRKDGDKDGARDLLAEAGIDLKTMQSIKEAHKAERMAHKDAIHEAVLNNDYEAFKVAIEGSPLADIITTEDDFAQFVKAHELREESNDIMEELGFPGGESFGNRQGHGFGHGKGFGHHSDDSAAS